jgi:hypothetical protein
MLTAMKALNFTQWKRFQPASMRSRQFPPVQTLLTAMDLMSLPCWWRNVLPSRSRSRPTQPSLFFYHYNTNNVQIFNIFLLIFKPITTRISFPLNYIVSNSSATCTPTVATKPVSSSAVFPTEVPPLQQYPIQQYFPTPVSLYSSIPCSSFPPVQTMLTAMDTLLAVDTLPMMVAS